MKGLGSLPCSLGRQSRPHAPSLQSRQRTVSSHSSCRPPSARPIPVTATSAPDGNGRVQRRMGSPAFNFRQTTCPHPPPRSDGQSKRRCSPSQIVAILKGLERDGG